MVSLSPAPSGLPIELWQHVLQNIVLRPLALDQALPNEVFFSNRNVLRQLCLVSRLLSAIARPYLYKTIILSNNGQSSYRKGLRGAGVDSLVYLTRTLAANHSLRPLIRNLAVPVSLSTGRANSLILAAGASLGRHEICGVLTQLNTTEREFFVAVGLLTRTTDELTESDTAASLAYPEALQAPEELPQKLIAVLLTMTHNVERLLLQDLFAEHTQVFDQAIRGVVDGSSAQMALLPDLKVLQVQAAFSNPPEGSRNYWEVLSEMETSSPLLNQPLLERLEVTCSWLNDLSVTKQVHRGLAQLKELNLIVTAGLAPLELFIQLPTSLRSLSLDFRTPRSGSSDGSARECDLNNVLGSRSETLELFTLDTTLCSAVHISEQLGPLERLICLPRLERLTHLSIEPHLLLDWLNVNTWPRFLNTLPPNLVHLTLRFVPENGEDLARIWARCGVGVALRAPRHKWQSKLPHLQHIHLDPLPFSSHATETLKEDLGLSGISLTWSVLENATELPLDLASLSIH